jgi:hypothetical protein
MNTIGEAWASYVADVIPPNAPAIQVEECKRSFYAGAQAMFQAVMLATEPQNEDDCEARLVSIEREMQDFLRLFVKREGIQNGVTDPVS